MGAESFYMDSLKILTKSKIPFLIGGTSAFSCYTGIKRNTKDLDVFCKAGDYPRILNLFSRKGYEVEIHDERWLAKVRKNEYYIDFIFGTIAATHPVDESWFSNKHAAKLFGQKLKLIPPEELIWSKAFRLERFKYDGADVNHLILKLGKKLDWKHILMRMEQHWEILLAHILMFRFVYPSQRDMIPKWLLKELLNRVAHQLQLPTPNDKVSRGPLLSHHEYIVDFTEWGFKSIT